MRRGSAPGQGARLAAAFLVAAALPVAAAAPARAEPAGAGSLFHVETTAAGIWVTSTQKPALSIITAGVVDSAVAYAASSVDASGGARARAAAYFPGDLVVQGPSLLCGLFGGCPADPPAYPLLADASYPTHQQDHVAAADRQGGDGAPVSLVGGAGDATAHDRTASAATQATAVSALAGTPAALTVGTSTARTATTVRTDGVHVTVETVLHDVSIAGLLHLSAVRAVDDVVVRPGAKPVDRPSVSVSGVSFAGQSAVIDESGVHVAGHDGPSPAQQLSGRGVSVALAGVDRSDTPDAARSTARGLTVTFAAPVSGVPYVPNPVPCPDGFPFCVGGLNVNATYVGTIVLGSVGAAVDAEPALDAGLGALPPLAGDAGIRGTAGSPAAVPGIAVGPRSQPAGAEAAPVVASAPQVRTRGFLAGLSRLRLDALYAALALGTMILFVGWRSTMTLAARRRR